MSNNILLINDMPGYGKVALSAMLPILSHMGYTLYNLPTALVSNTLDYGKFEILDTTNYMRQTIKVWQELDFKFDCIATGFIVSAEQVELVCDYIKGQTNKPFVLVDPIMGDDGHLYNGISPSLIPHMKKLCAVAEVVVPNYTEAALLTGRDATKPLTSQAELEAMIQELRTNGANSVIITSVNLLGEDCVYGYDAAKARYFQLPYTNIPVRFPGTGDIFSSVLLGKLQQGQALEVSVTAAMEAVTSLIKLNLANEDKYKGIPVERYLRTLE